MTQPETGWYLLEGGSILQMDHPLAEGIQQRVTRGEITRVGGPDGTPWQDPDPGAAVVEESVAQLLAAAIQRITELEADLERVRDERDDAQAELKLTRVAQNANKPDPTRATSKKAAKAAEA